MTAIYAYASAVESFAILAADDLCQPGARRVEKILPFGRFAVAFAGNEAPATAGSGLSWRIAARMDPQPASAEVLASEILDLLKLYVRSMYPRYERMRAKGMLDAAEWDALHSNDCELIILDTSAFKIARAEFGKPYPVGSLKSASVITPLAEGSLHFIARARVPDAETRSSFLHELRQDADPALRKRLADDRDWVENLHAIGELGSRVVVSGRSVEFRSAFKSARELLEADLKGTLEDDDPNIVVEDPGHE